MTRTIVWFSQGAASAVAAMLEIKQNPHAIVARCETNNEDEDNYRFEHDVSKWLHHPITTLLSEDYSSVIDVWEKRRFMSSVHGAPCTVAMKIEPRIAFQKPTDTHVFGYTADREDVVRFERLKVNYPELKVRAPLIDRGINKAATLSILSTAGVTPPRTYAMGFPNANCLKTGCVKASSPNYWSLFRHQFPYRFAAIALRSRSIGAKLTRINNERVFIDEIPADWPMTNPIVPFCDFLCILMESDGDVGSPQVDAGAGS